MEIVDEATGNSRKNDGTYEVLDFQEGDSAQRYLVYSKNSSNNLPLTTTMIDRKPCLKPSGTSARSKFFVTELDRTEKCTDENDEFEYDPRYMEVGSPISEFDLQEEYGIIQSLQRLHYHERSVDYGQKTQDMLTLWVRPTINWKLEGRCGKVPPQFVTETLDELDQGMALQHGWLVRRTRWVVAVWWLVIPIIAALTFCGVPYCEGLRDRKNFSDNSHLLCPILAQVIPILFAAGIFFQVNGVDVQIDENNDGLKKAAQLINGCVDQYTTIELQSNYDESLELQYYTGIIKGFSLTALIMLSIPAVLYLCVLLNAYCCSYGDDDEAPRERNVKQPPSGAELEMQAMKAQEKENAQKVKEKIHSVNRD